MEHFSAFSASPPFRPGSYYHLSYQRAPTPEAGIDKYLLFPEATDMVFSRPAGVPYPTVHHRFTVVRGGQVVPLRVQDLTEDMFPAAHDLLSRYFTRDEPPCRCIGINNYPGALKELQQLWWSTLRDKLSLACVVDADAAEEPALVGVNVMTVVCKDDKEAPFQTEDKTWAKLFGAVDLVARAVDIFERYGVERYLTAYGLVVDPAWRGMSIGTEILRARIPLCKALGVKVTATVFTAAASQAVAKKAGFKDLFEISYEELAARGFKFPGVEKDTKSSKLMALVIE